MLQMKVKCLLYLIKNMNNDSKIFVEVTATATINKNLSIEVPENASKEEIIEMAKNEFVVPTEGIKQLEDILNRLGVRVNNLDNCRNWDIVDIQYDTKYNN